MYNATPRKLFPLIIDTTYLMYNTIKGCISEIAKLKETCFRFANKQMVQSYSKTSFIVCYLQIL